MPTRERNQVQIALMRRTLGESPSSAEALEWIERNAKRISDILDDPRFEDIRADALAGDFEGAAEALEAMLGQHPTEHREAA